MRHRDNQSVVWVCPKYTRQKKGDMHAVHGINLKMKGKNSRKKNPTKTSQIEDSNFNAQNFSAVRLSHFFQL